uniref:Odorant binding protein n=1 Tax=Athetis dissimilis TaxID=1737331 RepID=A0A4D6Q600_ATHDI|nr:odorant binding protein [Athetis dissimilis]
MESCGYEKPPVNKAGEPIKPKGPKSILPYCRDGLCLMTNANLTLPNSAVDYKKLNAYIDQWAAANPEFTKIIMDIKPICAVEELRKKTKPRLCDHDRIYICLNSHLLWNCKIKPIKECDQLKMFMEACRSFYQKPRKKILD